MLTNYCDTLRLSLKRQFKTRVYHGNLSICHVSHLFYDAPSQSLLKVTWGKTKERDTNMTMTYDLYLNWYALKSWSYPFLDALHLDTSGDFSATFTAHRKSVIWCGGIWQPYKPAKHVLLDKYHEACDALALEVRPLFYAAAEGAFTLLSELDETL
jgi:hypothetical protein